MRWHSDHTDATGRVNKFAEDNGGIPGTTIVQYQFLSDGRAVRNEYRKCIAGGLADFNRLLDTHSAVLLEDCEKLPTSSGVYRTPGKTTTRMPSCGTVRPAQRGRPLRPISGSPGSLSPSLKPVGWGAYGDADERGRSEPGYRDGDGSARKKDAVAFVGAKFADLLDRWGRVCACRCNARWP